MSWLDREADMVPSGFRLRLLLEDPLEDIMNEHRRWEGRIYKVFEVPVG